jgi:hypothetical protein
MFLSTAYHESKTWAIIFHCAVVKLDAYTTAKDIRKKKRTQIGV